MTVRIFTDWVLEIEVSFSLHEDGEYRLCYAVQKGITLIIEHGLHELEPETKERQGVPLSSYRDAIKGVSFHISYVFFVFSNINSNENLDSR